MAKHLNRFPKKEPAITPNSPAAARSASLEALQSANEALTTENKALKEKIEELSLANSDLENMMQATDIATIFLDRNLNIKRYTPLTTEIFNISPGDTGKPIAQITHQLSPDNFLKDATKVLQSLQPQARDVHLEDGRTYSARFTPYHTLEGKIDGLVISFMEITERKKMENILRHSEKEYSAIVNQAVAGILTLDTSGRVLFGNEHFEKMLGYTQEELLKLNMTDLVYEKDRERLTEKLEALKENGHGFMIEKRMLRKDGAHFWVNNYNSPIFDKEGKLKSVAIISVDISQQKTVEKRKDDFISIASHELKTPLTSIKAYGEILLEKFADNKNEESKMLVQRLNGQILRLYKLVISLLDTNNISGGKMVLNFDDFDMNELIQERVADAQLTSTDHELIIKSDMLPTVHADRERIGQVLTNLLTNAIKYSPGAKEVMLHAEKMGDTIKVSIQDFGMGMDSGEREKIFKRFYQIKPSDYATSGLGLGLYISLEIIKMHGGLLEVKSQPGEGSIFNFTLPIAPKKD